MTFYGFNIPKAKKALPKWQALIRALLVLAVIAVGIDYVTLPAYNIHDTAFIMLVVFYLFIFGMVYFVFSYQIDFIVKLCIGLGFALIAFTLVFSFLSSEMLNAGRYRDQIQITSSNEFNAQFDAIELEKIPLVDQNTAQQLGDKQIGRVQGLGSQFDINDEYILINQKDNVYRVSPLEYQDSIKWFQNREKGIPGYVRVNVTDASDVKLIELNEGIKYAPSAFLSEDLMRHVRFKYRTEIFDATSFEIDDEGNPFYVISVIEPEIGWFGGWDTSSVITVDAVNGDMQKYAIEEMPAWVDRAQSARIAWYQIDNWGYYVNGWINTLFGQKDMIQTTDGFNYVSIDGQTHIFSGLTSVGADRSIVGFALINLRTKEASYIQIGGADELSAMNSATGQVQHLNYESTFPVLLNVDGFPTYFMALKDYEGLVKLYAMVSVQDYALVGVGASVEEARLTYLKQLKEGGQIVDLPIDAFSAEGIVLDIKEVVLDGTSVYYLMLEGQSGLFIVSSKTSVEASLTKVGDEVSLTYQRRSDMVYDVQGFDNLNLDY